MPLPAGVAISGEWYLGVRAHSAVPEIGFRIIQDELTSRSAEFSRLWDDIGLPVTAKFYDTKDLGAFFPRHFKVSERLKLGELLKTAYRRSNIHCYHLFAQVLARNLRQLLGTPNPDISEVAEKLVHDTKLLLDVTDAAR